MEEGEISQNLDNPNYRHDEDTNLGRSENCPVENGQSLDNQEPVEVHGFSSFKADQNSKVLHGNVAKAAHVEGVNDEVMGHVVNSNEIPKDGPNNLMDLNDGLNTGLNNSGPVLGPNLGKRNREERSPPSIGSTQGPTQRVYNQPNRPTVEPIDLNTPVREKSSIVGEHESEHIATGPLDKSDALDPTAVASKLRVCESGVEIGVGSADGNSQLGLEEEVNATIRVGN
ncbi:hypothetical protein Hanom_Chr08g00734241 [Helianthus anomalus]